MRVLVFSANLEVENIRTPEVKIKRTVSSWFVVILGKIGFYNKLGVVFWSLFASALQVYDSYDYFIARNSWDASTFVEIASFFVYFSMILSTPTAIYKIQYSASSILQGKNLKPPLHYVLLLLPAVILAFNSSYIWFSPDINIKSADVILTTLAHFLTDFVTAVLFPLLPNFLMGILTSTFVYECQHFRQNISRQPRTEARQLLMLFRSIKEGCQLLLFVIFVGYTLVCIGVSYLIAMTINGCLLESQNKFGYATFAMLILVCALFLMYFGFTMEDCFDEFIKIADTLRLVKKN